MIDIILDDFKWSFSKLNTFDTCKYGFYLQYIEGREGIQNSFAQFGTCCHQILEMYAKNEIELFELVNQYEKLYPEIVTERFPPNKYVDLGENYYNQGLEYFTNFNGFDDIGEVVGVEKFIEFNIGEYEFCGFIDLILKSNNDKIIIVDHKTKGKMTKKEQNKYLKQFYLYSVPLIEEYKNNPESLRFNMVRFQNWIVEPFDSRKLEETKEWASNTIKDIYKEKDWKPCSNSYFCNFVCGQRRNCEYIPNVFE